MSDIRIEREIGAPPGEILKRIESEMRSVPNLKMFIEEYRLEESTLSFGGSRGVSGSVQASPGRLVVEVALTGFNAMMKGMVETKLNRVLDDLLEGRSPDE